MKACPHTGFGFLLIGIILFLGCQSMYISEDAATSGSDFAQRGVAGSGFSAVQIDPRSEDSAGPVFVAAGDLDGDSLMDLASAWNESQPVQIHLQRRNANGDIAFMTVPLGGTTPIARVAGLEVADLDDDGRLDVVVLIKNTGLVATCDESRDDCDVTDNGGVIDEAVEGGIAIFYNPGDATGTPWDATVLTNSFLAGRDEGESLELGGYTGLAVGEIDGLDGLDIVVAFNSAEGDPQLNSIDLWANPGPGRARNPDVWTRAMIYADLPGVGACRILDVDRDGDGDVVCTYPTSASVNVRWLPNPLDLGEPSRVYGPWGLHAPVGQISTGADTIEIGDLDGDGIADILARSSTGRVVQWFQAPAFPPYDFVRSPWRVYTLAEFRDREPRALAMGDLTGDGRLEVAISAEGAVAWFSSQQALSVFDQWGEALIIDDNPPGSDADPSAADPSASITDLLQLLTDPQQQTQQESTVTVVNSLLIEDIDGDGLSDIVGTLDRADGSGLTNDALILLRNRRIR